MTNSADQAELHKRGRILFWYGQLPSVGSTVLFVLYLLYLGRVYELPGSIFLTVALGIICILLTEGALALKTCGRLWSVLLTLSMFLTVCYVNLLVGGTGGAGNSPFDNYYLYMPAVVFLVTKKNWAELLCAGLCILSYADNRIHFTPWPSWLQLTTGDATWQGWVQFSGRSYYNIFDTVILGFFLVLAYHVNRKLEPPKENLAPVA